MQPTSSSPPPPRSHPQVPSSCRDVSQPAPLADCSCPLPPRFPGRPRSPFLPSWAHAITSTGTSSTRITNTLLSLSRALSHYKPPNERGIEELFEIPGLVKQFSCIKLWFTLTAAKPLEAVESICCWLLIWVSTWLLKRTYFSEFLCHNLFKNLKLC